MKDHPVVVISIAVAGALTFSVVVVLPTYTASLSNQVAEIPSIKLEKAEAQAKVVKLESKIKTLQIKLAALQRERLFEPNSLYPIGFSRVRIGDPLSALEQIFPVESIEKEDAGFWTVKAQHPLFTDVTYYFLTTDKQKRIHHIKFYFRPPSEESSDLLQEKLLDALGQPTETPKSGFFAWEKDGQKLYKDSKIIFSILPKNRQPILWAKK